MERDGRATRQSPYRLMIAADEPGGTRISFPIPKGS